MPESSFFLKELKKYVYLFEATTLAFQLVYSFKIFVPIELALPLQGTIGFFLATFDENTSTSHLLQQVAKIINKVGP